jgi:hypothetical protein
VPILGLDSRLVGLLVLGPRLSEEPYSGEDKDLLDSVASQAGITLENIRLAQKMAERIEAERRAATEIDLRAACRRGFSRKKYPCSKHWTMWADASKHVRSAVTITTFSRWSRGW